MNVQRKKSKSERKRRLTEVPNHAEEAFLLKVWWPAFGHFANLHAEFETKDFKDGRRFVDFAYISGGYKICIEIDGYGTHGRDLDRQKFADHLNRQNHLVLDGWTVIRFSYDEIIEKPRHCQQILQQLLGRLNGTNKIPLSPPEKAVYDLARAEVGPLTPARVAAKLGVHRKTGAKYLRSLSNKGYLTPLATQPSSRIVRYANASSDIHTSYSL